MISITLSNFLQSLSMVLFMGGRNPLQQSLQHQFSKPPAEDILLQFDGLSLTDQMLRVFHDVPHAESFFAEWIVL